MTSLPKGYFISRLKAGHQSVVVRDGQNKTEQLMLPQAVTAGSSCLQQNDDSFYRAQVKSQTKGLTGNFGYDWLATKGMCHPKTKSWPSLCNTESVSVSVTVSVVVRDWQNRAVGAAAAGCDSR